MEFTFPGPERRLTVAKNPVFYGSEYVTITILNQYATRPNRPTRPATREATKETTMSQVTITLADGTQVTGTLVKSTAKTPAKLATYRVLPGCPTIAKGKQRQEVLNVLHTDAKRAWTREAVAELVSNKYPTKFPVADSVGYHLHLLGKEGHVEVK